MKDMQSLNRNFEAYAWGGIFVWWGLTELIPALPNGIGALGIGLILLGLNAARGINGIPTNGFSILVGALALIWGGLDLADAILRLPFEVPVFAIMLIVLGLMLIGREILQNKKI